MKTERDLYFKWRVIIAMTDTADIIIHVFQIALASILPLAGLITIIGAAFPGFVKPMRAKPASHIARTDSHRTMKIDHGTPINS